MQMPKYPDRDARPDRARRCRTGLTTLRQISSTAKAIWGPQARNCDTNAHVIPITGIARSSLRSPPPISSDAGSAGPSQGWQMSRIDWHQATTMSRFPAPNIAMNWDAWRVHFWCSATARSNGLRPRLNRAKLRAQQDAVVSTMKRQLAALGRRQSHGGNSKNPCARI